MLQDDSFCKHKSWKGATKASGEFLQKNQRHSKSETFWLEVQDLLLRCREIAKVAGGNQPVTSPFPIETQLGASGLVGFHIAFRSPNMSAWKPWQTLVFLMFFWRFGEEEVSPGFFSQVFFLDFSDGRFHLEKSIPTDMKPGSATKLFFWAPVFVFFFYDDDCQKGKPCLGSFGVLGESSSKEKSREEWKEEWLPTVFWKVMIIYIYCT